MKQSIVKRCSQRFVLFKANDFTETFCKYKCLKNNTLFYFNGVKTGKITKAKEI